MRRCDGGWSDMKAGPEASRVSDVDAIIGWHTRLFGRPLDRLPATQSVTSNIVVTTFGSHA
jgi:hypothetical protein